MLKRNKRLISKIILLAMCTSLVPTTIAFAETVNLAGVTQQDTSLNYSGDNGEWTYQGTYESLGGSILNGIRFHIYEDNKTYYINNGYSTLSGTLNIPSRIIFNGNKYSLASVAEYAFRDCTNLENVSIPTGVTYVPQGMFENCSSLKTVLIPSSVNKELWGQVSAFADCSSLEKIEVNEGNTIYESVDGVLYNKVGTKVVIYPAAKQGESYKIPDNVVSIMEGAFRKCKNLNSVEMTDNVIEINNDAFLGCSGLQTVKMPNNIKTINASTFEGCSNLTNMTIPSSVTSIRDSAFKGCSSLTNITIPSNVTNISDSLFEGCSKLTNITIPSNVTAISDSAFKDCTNLTNVIIPSSVSKIATNAFENCNKENLIFWVPNNDIRLLLINANVDNSKIRIGAGTGSSETTQVNSIAINTTNSNWTVGQTGILTASILPSNATNQTVTWLSSDTSIATVDNNGLVRIKAKGTVTITATAADGSGVNQTKTITISGQDANTGGSTNQTDVKVTGITIDGSSNITTKGGTISLTSNILPSTATNKNVTWTSSNPSVANVNSQGVVTAISNGSAIIIASASDGSNITVTKSITVTGQATTSDNSSNSDLKSVSISGTEEVSHRLKAKVKYDGTKPSLSYQWQRASKKDGDYTDISGADDEEYKLKSSDKNKYIKVIVSATINGTNYKVEDITSKIDRDTSNDHEDDSSDSSSNSSTISNNNNNIVVLRPLTAPNAGTNTAVANTLGTNSISPAYGVFTNPAGHPVTGWVKSYDKWYYQDNNGIHKVGWLNYNSKWYYLDQSGVMVSNAAIDGYWLGADGAMI